MIFRQFFSEEKVFSPPGAARVLAVLFLLFTQSVFGQDRLLTGVVVDADNVTLPGVSIVAKGTMLGSVTDAEGKFSLSVPADTKILIFTFVGMKTKEVEVGPENSFRVMLEEEAVGLEEVIVVGYGIQKKASVVGAISQIDNKELVRSGMTNVT